MSAEGQGDSLSLDKQEEASSSASEPGIPKDSSETEVSVSSPPKSSTLNTLTFMGEEIEPFDDDVEAVIEKKLHPLIKDKGPDVDSELDFELKWDDDSDNQSALKIDAKLDESLELDDDDALTDDPQKTKADNVALKAELKTIEEDNNDQLKVIDEIGEVSAKEAGNEAIQVEKSTEFVPNIEIEAPDIDETGKINPDSKISSEASENSSVDEPLVYSDVEVPEIEDKELLDEIDAQICDAEFNEEEKDMEDTTVSPKPSFVPERSEESDDVDSPKHITDSAIDVDEVSKSFDNKTDPNDTSSANNDLETSSYEINNDHRLTKPDVMLEIPTQELIESLDDSEMSDGALEYDEDVLLSNDAPNKDPDVIEDKDLAESSEIIEETPDKDEITDEKVILCDDDTTKTDTCVTDQDILENENIDEKMNVSDETSDIIVTDADEIETMDVDENGSHADIILDASHLAENPETDANSQLTDEATPIMEADVTSPTFTAPFDTEAVDDSSIDELQPVASMNVDNAIVAETELNITEIVSENLEDVKEKPCAVDMEPEEAVEVVNAEEITEDVMVAKEAITTMDETDKSDPVANIVISSEIVSTETTDQESVSTEVAKSDNLDTTENISVSENPQEATTSATDLPSIVNDDKKDTPIEENLEVTDDNLSKEVCDAELKDAKEVIDDSQTVEQPAEESPKEVTNEELEEVKDVNACKEKEASLEEQQPSTSKYMQESSDEDQEVTDSLGLLAESSRVMDDDDEPENEDDDDDDDFDQDDESNHMTAEHSEDSNAQHSETEVAKETMEAEESTEKELQFQIDDVVSGVSGIDDVTTETEVPENLEESMKVSEESEVEKAVQSLLEVGDDTTTEDVVDNVAEEVEDTTDYAVKSPLSKDLARDEETAGAASKLKELLSKDREGDETVEAEKTSPSKTRKLEIAKPKNEINIVELEESSSEDDIQEVLKPSEVTSVNIPEEVEVMSASAGNTSDMRQGEGEVVISGVPKPSPQKTTRLNTGELTIKTAAAVTESLVIPETAMPANAQQPKLGLEIFSLDSDEEDKEPAVPDDKPPPLEVAPARCSNPRCGVAAPPPGPRRGAVCRACDAALIDRRLGLIEGIKEFSPLLTLDMGQVREELVEISDSDSDEDTDAVKPAGDAMGEKEASFLEDQLASMFNNTWKKYNLDERLQAAVTEINLDVKNLEEECSKIDSMLNECQVATDKLRNDLYDTFSGEKNELPAVVIFDTPNSTWSGLEENIQVFDSKETRQSKRRSSVVEPPAKRPAIPLGYSPLEGDGNTANNSKVAASNTDVAVQNDDDNSDISVVKLSAESAPADLPGPGTPTRPPLRVQMPVYAMRNAFGSWSKARIIDVQPKVNQNQFTTCRVKFEHKVKNPTKVLQARCLAYEHPSDVRMTIGTRLIALFKDNDNKRESYYSGIVAEIPNPVNNYRYLVFFDDGYAQYVPHSATRLVCESAPLVWDEVHPFSRQFVREYLRSYPERPMVRVHAGQSIRTEYNGKWWDSKVLQVDASLVQVHFDKENRTEWIYRGSTRLAPLYWELQAAERPRARPLPRAQHRLGNVPYVEYTRSDETPPAPVPGPKQIEQDIRRQRAVAKKSTAAPPPPAAPQDAVASRVVFYTPKNAIRPHKMVPHTCGPRCKRTDVLALKDLRTYNPLTKPLLSGWERQIVKYKWSRSVMYRAPCGRRLRSYQELHRYLQITNSDMPVDLFDFGPNTHCLAEFVLTKCRISKKDLSHGKENVPVPCVNYYDDSLPEFCSYNTERTPTAGVPLNLDPEFLCGCDCTDDCADKSKCACWKMTLEGARTIGLDSEDVGYVYKRLPEPLPSGIYECNSRCKCRQTCLNRVAQHPLQLKLQVFKTLNRGWGIRALNDIPKGAFLCVYAGNLLTDATANLDGLNEGDEYLAELDYIEVVEQMKEGFEEDVPDADKKLDKESADQEDESSTTSSEEEEDPRKDADDDDFRPALPLAPSTTEFSKRLRKRDKKKKDDTKEKQKEKDKEPNSEDNCITISDDEELREPARFAAQAGMDGKGFVSKYKSVRAHFGKDEACYIMDAKVQGNIGRYLNHSCTPNVFVQNVFVDTHDPRFPWVAFFALSHIRAGTELTWNYNYDVGSVPGKVLYCHCAAPNCRGRLL